MKPLLKLFSQKVNILYDPAIDDYDPEVNKYCAQVLQAFSCPRGEITLIDTDPSEGNSKPVQIHVHHTVLRKILNAYDALPEAIRSALGTNRIY